MAEHNCLCTHTLRLQSASNHCVDCALQCGSSCRSFRDYMGSVRTSFSPFVPGADLHPKPPEPGVIGLSNYSSGAPEFNVDPLRYCCCLDIGLQPDVDQQVSCGHGVHGQWPSFHRDANTESMCANFCHLEELGLTLTCGC